MHSADQTMQDLVRRAGQGDALALAELRQELQPQMIRIVRRALRTETVNSALAQRIRTTVHQVYGSAKNRSAKDSDGLVGQVARRLCDVLAGHLQVATLEGREIRETIRNS